MGCDRVGLITIVTTLVFIAPRRRNHGGFSRPFVRFCVSVMNGRSDNRATQIKKKKKRGMN